MSALHVFREQGPLLCVPSVRGGRDSLPTVGIFSQELPLKVLHAPGAPPLWCAWAALSPSLPLCLSPSPPHSLRNLYVPGFCLMLLHARLGWRLRAAYSAGPATPTPGLGGNVGAALHAACLPSSFCLWVIPGLLFTSGLHTRPSSFLYEHTLRVKGARTWN